MVTPTKAESIDRYVRCAELIKLVGEVSHEIRQSSINLILCFLSEPAMVNVLSSSATLGPDIPRVTFSSAQNRYVSKQDCDQIFTYAYTSEMEKIAKR